MKHSMFSPAQAAHRYLLPDCIRPFADALTAAMPGDAWQFAFASNYGARVTRADDDAWFLDVLVPQVDTTIAYPFMPRRQPISDVLLAAGLELLQHTPYVDVSLDASFAIIRTLPSLDPLSEVLYRMWRATWLPVYAELVFAFGNHGVFVRWAPANASVGLHTDVVTADIRRIHVGFNHRLTVGELRQECSTSTVRDAADVLMTIDCYGVDAVMQQRHLG